MTTRELSSACSKAIARSSVTTTPLPAASPSCFTTYGAPKVSSARSTSSRVSHVKLCAVRTPASRITCFAKSFDPSISAAAFDGPKTAKPALRRSSDNPWIKGFSGPMTTRSIPSDSAKAITAALSSVFVA